MAQTGRRADLLVPPGGDIGSSSVLTFTQMTDFPILEGENVTPTTGMIGAK